MIEQNYGTIEGYYCKECKGEHKRGDALFSEHFADNFPPAQSMTDELLLDKVIINERAKNIIGAPWGSVVENLEWLLKKQISKVINKRLDRPELREIVEIIDKVLIAHSIMYAGQVPEKYTETEAKIKVHWAKEILALIPDEEEIRAKLNAEIRIELGSKAFEKGRKQERERIINWLRDLKADEYMLARLNNELIIKAIQAGGQALREEK